MELDYNVNQRSLRDSTILHGVCVGENVSIESDLRCINPGVSNRTLR